MNTAVYKSLVVQVHGTRISTKSFYVHHSQMLSKAAVMHDAKAILKQVTCLKQRACIAANAADGGARA